MIQWLRYVPHNRINEFQAMGWVLADSLAGTSHGQWSVLMKWEGEGEPG